VKQLRGSLSMWRNLATAVIAVACAIIPVASSASGQERVCNGPLGSQWTDCVGVHVFAWGGRYEGQWKNGKMHGQGKEFSADGALVRDGKWVEGAYQGGAQSLAVQAPEKQAATLRETMQAGIQQTPPQPAPQTISAPTAVATPVPAATSPKINFRDCVGRLEYPEAAKEKRIIGITTVAYEMNEEGAISSATVLVPSGNTPEYAQLDQTVVEAIKTCKGTPGTKDGVPQKHRGRTSYSWIIEGGQVEPNVCSIPVTPEMVASAVDGVTDLRFRTGPEGEFAGVGITKRSGNTKASTELDYAAWKALHTCPAVRASILNGFQPKSEGAVYFKWTTGLQKPQLIRAPSISAITCKKPEYTTAARRAEAEGTTTIEYTLSDQGYLVNATVKKSSGPTREHKQLDRSALEAIKSCTGGAPLTIDGMPTGFTGDITYSWRLQGGGAGFDFSSLLMLPLMLLKR
jgi:TonB family protein